MMFSADQLVAVRRLFPHTATGRIYLNHAGTSPLSTRVVAAMQEHLRTRSEGEIDTYPRDIEIAERARGSVARLINAEGPERVTLQGNTSDAINIVAAGLEWKSGDEIILNTLEFPANVYPFLNLKRYGVGIRVLQSADGRITPEQIERAITPRTRLVALSAVQYLTGHRADLRAIGSLCRMKGIVFAVDAIQAVGAVRIDVRGMKIDACAAGAQKWQMGPHGTGFLYLTEDLQSRIKQQYLGWLAVAVPWDFQNYEQPLAASARRYEGGTLNFPGIIGYDAALTMFGEFSPAEIERHILDLTTRLHRGLSAIPGGRVITPEPEEERAGIVTLELPPGVEGEWFISLTEREGVIPAIREGKIRYSPHFYVTPEEIDRTIEATARGLAGT